ncbi:acetyl-CoA carboxylase biotin carboxyl carrier protein subunit [Corynebacterium incognita]|uniref:Acetyl-CoA carboxylase biotin carboxyl carrier protein subunit n=1 Tax=Corynebacterium incognita TaxID=2754725 RepID=A0A7G7CPF5_9CORY|nr:acetyl-CoA carboxylase biotin carboxyl carrier protein subunit [Corynebacterium incognita]QNE89471.1 acetyl-CoA carboxylase biotin carboxyl carrier protein subunit [Corynebacterium incognita]
MEFCAPFAGIVRFSVAPGEHVAVGQTLATVEATKLEAPVVAPGPGVVESVAHADFESVSGGDVLLRLADTGLEQPL